MSTNEVDQIKQRIDIVDLVSQYVTLKKAGTNYKGVCPFHNEKTPSLMVSSEKQIWKCFGCGKGGDQFNFVMEAEHLQFPDALRLLAQKAGVTLQPKTTAEYRSSDNKATLYQINRLASAIFHELLVNRPAGEVGRQYLKKRGLIEPTIKEFQIGLAPEKFDLKKYLLGRGFQATDVAKAGSPERFFNRLMFPIFDVIGNVVGFTGRTLGDNEPKYLNTAETSIFNKGRLLYGLDKAKGAIKDRQYVVLVEGQMDVVSLHQAGVKQAVASSGTAITQTQIELLSKYTENFLLAFDNDPAGQQTTKKVIELLLRLDLNSKVIDYGQYKDAGELFQADPKVWAVKVKEAKEGLDWWLDQAISESGNLDFIENKKKVLKIMLPVVRLVHEPTRFDYYTQQLAGRLGVKPDSIRGSINNLKPDNSPVSRPAKSVLETADFQLTNEEQLLAILIGQPKNLTKYRQLFDQVVWQSVDAARIAEELKKCYNDKALIANQPVFLSRLKTNLTPQIGGKMDSWQFWFSNQWPEASGQLIDELLTEKLAQLKTQSYEREKTSLAQEISQAQRTGDIKQVKNLMTKLNQLTKTKKDD